MVTNIAERSLPKEERQMIHALVKRMLTETDPRKLKMYSEQIGRIASASEKMSKAA
jgi:hypothetical protein